MVEGHCPQNDTLLFNTCRFLVPSPPLLKMCLSDTCSNTMEPQTYMYIYMLLQSLVSMKAHYRSWFTSQDWTPTVLLHQQTWDCNMHEFHVNP
jgi:hypothetical protein